MTLARSGHIGRPSTHRGFHRHRLKGYENRKEGTRTKRLKRLKRHETKRNVLGGRKPSRSLFALLSLHFEPSFLFTRPRHRPDSLEPIGARTYANALEGEQRKVAAIVRLLGLARNGHCRCVVGRVDRQDDACTGEEEGKLAREMVVVRRHNERG